MINNRGFTLVELMIAMVISSFLVTAVYAAHTTQQRTYHVQEQVAEMQQNLRAALYFITSEIRIAGYDPERSGNFGITSALAGRLQFTVDLDEDGTLDGAETIGIGFTNDSNSDHRDVVGDGIPDLVSNGIPNAVNIGKQTGSDVEYKAFAGNIQALEFLYLDSAGAVTATNSNIRSIQITILARARRSDQKFTNTITYVTPSRTNSAGTTSAGQTWGPYNDNFRRRMLTTTIRCRN